MTPEERLIVLAEIDQMTKHMEACINEGNYDAADAIRTTIEVMREGME